jgi:hypothetical protein
MGQKSWEYYQNLNNAILNKWWICGAAATFSVGDLQQPLISSNQFWAVPFNMIRNATVSAIGFSLFATANAGSGAALRLGIYTNNSDTNSFPSTLVAMSDSGDFDVSNGQNTGLRMAPITPGLAIDKRYWAVMLTNGNVAGAKVNFLAEWSGLFWGAVDSGTNKGLIPAKGIVLANPGSYGSLPNSFPNVAGANVAHPTSWPAIGLQFSA